MNERKTIAEERRVHERVSKLEEAMDAHFAEHTQFVTMLSDGIKSVEISGEKLAASMSEIADVLKLYQDTRGFMITVKAIGNVILWIVATGGAVTVVAAAIKHWILT